MIRKSAIALAVLGLIGLAAGCSDSDPTVTPEGDLASSMVTVALQSDLTTERVISGELVAMQPEGASNITTVQRTFSHDLVCPGGGDMMVEGVLRSTYDPTIGLMEAEGSGSRARTDCTFMRDGLTITINGTSQWETYQRRVDGRPDGLQTNHYWGSWIAVSSDGEELSCEFDFTIVRDPDAGTRTLEGTTCGDQMRRQTSWNQD